MPIVRARGVPTLVSLPTSAPVVVEGPPGASAVLRRADSEIQWRRDPGGKWTALVPLDELRGDPGPQGPPPALRAEGAYLQAQTAGGEWHDVLPLSMLKGDTGTARNGTDAAEVELRVDGGVVQWRRIGSPWQSLISVASLKGEPGASGTTLMGTVTVGQGGTIAVVAGLREVSVAAPWAVAGGRYVGTVDSASLNGATATAGAPAGYALIAVTCRVNGTLVVTVSGPVLAVGKSFAMTVAVHRLG